MISIGIMGKYFKASMPAKVPPNLLPSLPMLQSLIEVQLPIIFISLMNVHMVYERLYVLISTISH